MSSHQTSTHSRTRTPNTAIRTASPRLSRRLRLMRGVFVVVFAALGVRLFFLQVVDHAYYAQLSVRQVHEDLVTTALRAGIYDRYGKILAVSRPTSLILADDLQISHPLREAEAVSPLIKIPVPKLTSLLSEKGPGSGHVILNGALDLTDGRKISSLVFPGITVQDSSVRGYPNGTLAGSILGGTNSASQGTSGLESKYQLLLAGKTGITRELVSATGVNLPSSLNTVISKAQPGIGLELTLDSSLQFVTERTLAHQLVNTGALTGLAVVMDVKTGEVLADASLVNTKVKAGVLGPIPALGHSIGVPGVEQTLYNLPFSQAYEPGSIFKIVTFSAALQAGLITPSTVFPVPNSAVVGGRYFHDAENHGLEHLSATQILALSSNIGTYEIGTRVGETGILAQVKRLGFGQMTSVGAPDETPGLLVNPANWHTADEVALPIGQVDAVPPIQVLDAYNAIANGGIFVEPKLVRGFVYSNGTVKAAAPSTKREVLSPTVAGTMNTMLRQVVLAGTGTNAVIPGYSVAGKTGTASMPDPRNGQKLLTGDFEASFVGFAPANAPVLSMIVVIERPQTTIYGGTAAAPIFQQVMSYALRHYGIPSNGTVQRPKPGSGASIASDMT